MCSRQAKTGLVILALEILHSPDGTHPKSIAQYISTFHNMRYREAVLITVWGLRRLTECCLVTRSKCNRFRLKDVKQCMKCRLRVKPELCDKSKH